MNKINFLRIYRPLLTIHFYDDVFLNDNRIRIVEQRLTLKDVLDFYVLRAIKNDMLDDRPIEERENDPECSLITLKQARQAANKWDLVLGKQFIPHLNNLRPIPIATDTNTDLTLMMDSNHLLANLQTSKQAKIRFVRIIGPELERVVRDFKILNRISKNTF